MSVFEDPRVPSHFASRKVLGLGDEKSPLAVQAFLASFLGGRK